MNTPAHLIVGAAAFARPGNWKVNLAAVMGAAAPDLSLYFMAGVSLFLLDIPARVVFDEYYFSAAWQQVFAIDNSFVIWAAGFALAYWFRHPAGIAFAGAALLHLMLDFPLHHDDARRHFWPVTDWVFVSPVSYWDSAHFGAIVGPLEIALSAILCAVLWRRFVTLWSRLTIVAVAGLQMAPLVIWALVFAF